MKISEKLKIVKNLSGVSQEKLSQMLEVSFVTLNSWINERSIPHKKKQVVIDNLYKRYTGQNIIPETALEAKKEMIKTKKKKYKNILKLILERKDLYDSIVLSFTYNTNSIEGSTLSENETATVLFQNKALSNKSLIEQLEAKNHQSALNYLLNYLTKSKDINEELIFKLHSILMNSIRDDAGYYRNHGVRIVGSNVPTANYLKISKLMNDLIVQIKDPKKDIITNITEIHSIFEKIHPFSDGNGRIGRLIITAMLLKYNFPPAIIKQENKSLYYSYLSKSQIENDYSLLEDFICDAIMNGFELIE